MRPNHHLLTIVAASLFTLPCVGLGETKPPATAPSAEEEASSGKRQANQETLAALDWRAFPDETRVTLLGLPWFKANNPKLWRMPQDAFPSLTSGVRGRCRIPSGARLMLRSNSADLAIRIQAKGKSNSRGLDVYLDGRFYRSAVPGEAEGDADLLLFSGLDRKDREITVYLPHDQELTIAAVGVDKGATVAPAAHKFARPLPVVFYGSSVCQGTGAGKPGMTYEAVLCRELNLDFVNLGFGGAGKAEDSVVELVNSLPACCYVFDLGKSYGSQDKTAFERMLRKIRASHPDTPIICMTPITSSVELHSADYSARSVHTRTVMREAVAAVLAGGDKRLRLLEGTDLLGFDEHDGLSKDGVHPSDYGYILIARRLAPVIKKALGL
jgi:hypothetical protein